MIEVWVSGGVTVARTSIGSRVLVCAGATSLWGWKTEATKSGRRAVLVSNPLAPVTAPRALELARAFARRLV